MRLYHLVEALGAKGFKISMNETQLKFFQPRSSPHLKRENTRKLSLSAFVKYWTITNDRHENANFCFSLAEGLYVLGSILGEEAVIISPVWLSDSEDWSVCSKDANSNCNTPWVQLRLPNHDFIDSNKHHLIPSVYAFLDINHQKVGRSTAVSGKGPMAVFIRSGKHDRSTPSVIATVWWRL